MSAIPQITAAIFTKLQQDIVGVPIVFGYATNREQIAIWETQFEREYRLLGPVPAPMDETFKVNLLVEVLIPSGRDMTVATDRCWEIFEQMDTAVRGDHTVTGLSWNALIQTGKQEFFQTAEQQGCRIRAALTGTARV